MTVVSKTSAFPKSVQPGIPALGPKPAGWLRGPLSDHLFEQQRPIRMGDDTEYRLVTVKRSRGGVVTREYLKGREISVKTQFLLHRGDFLISKRQIVHGACGIVPAELEGSIASNEYAILRGKPTVDLNFLNYLAHSIYFQQTCFHSSIGVHVEKMIFKLDRWLSWDFDLPPLPEQRKIAEILSTWDRAIEVTQMLIANARAQKKALMQHLLTGKKRLPGFGGEWEVVEIKKMGQTSSGGTPDSDNPSYWDGDVLWTTPTDITALDSVYIYQTKRRITHKGLKASSAKLLPINSILVCSRATVGSMAIAGNPIATNQGFKNLIPNGSYDSRFLYFLFSQNKKLFIRYSCGSTFLELSKTDFDKLKFAVPEFSEQKAIADVLVGSASKLEVLQNQLSGLKTEKSALMQQLLTGKHRVMMIGKEAACA